MTTHISVRLAWHADGWNGHVCKDPAANTYCVGSKSYPGGMIGERRNLEQEKKVCGQSCQKLGKDVPPCMYSVNAFGDESIYAFADTPDFFKDGERREWTMPPASATVWPYEAMYADDVKTNGRADPKKRLSAVSEYFNKIEVSKSLVFYYANYSNPFSEEDNQRYVLIGVSRVKSLGEELFYDGCSKKTIEQFGGFVWQRVVSSDYPNQGFRIPYHRYKDNPEILQQLLAVPANPRICKYASRHVTDDDALILVEQLLSVAIYLKTIGDNSENWDVRITWLQSIIAELWIGRGLYPGLPALLDVLGFQSAITYFVKEHARGADTVAKNTVFDFLDGKIQSIPELSLSEADNKKILRQWALREDDEKVLCRDLLPRFELDVQQIKRILSTKRIDFGIQGTLKEINENPFLLSESYVGDGADDIISIYKIEHGVYPSPNVSPSFLMELDDARRLRAWSVHGLQQSPQHVFLDLPTVLNGVNKHLANMVDWKRHQFTLKYYEIDRKELLGALEFRKHENLEYVYLCSVWEDERLLENVFRDLLKRPDISFKKPVTKSHWQNFLHQSDSVLGQNDSKKYQEAIAGQVEVCQQLFVRPMCVLSGGAGTGKTTIIKALINAIERTDGSGSSFQLLAPTGKAADRIREKTGKDAATIHAFLAQRGWLNDNFTLKRQGGNQEGSVETYIIDESSMMDITLTAALFRAINWNTVRRLILVGDPNQLPPIGCGKIFADLIDFLQSDYSDSLGVLKHNVRQMENVINKAGTGILELASVFIQRNRVQGDELAEVTNANILSRVHEGGEVDKDLRIEYWKDQAELEKLLVNLVWKDMEEDTSLPKDIDKPWVLWSKAFENSASKKTPEMMQVISPYRGEFYGTDNLNILLQTESKGRRPDSHRLLGGIAFFDKVIQIRNRPKSNPIWAWNCTDRKANEVEVYNGELAFVKPHALDGQNWQKTWFRIKHFQAVFSRKEHLWVGYGKELGKTPEGAWIPEQKVEDNLELAYAISVHKSQGSEFERVYFVLPQSKAALLSPELLYTGLTRAKRHCTLLIEKDISPLLALRRPESSHLAIINASLFIMRPVPPELVCRSGWYEEGKIHKTLTEFMVRSKSEVIIANMLFERSIPFHYEPALFAKDGTFYLPDFVLKYQGRQIIWEHWGRMDLESYKKHREVKVAWYNKHFPGQLIETFEGSDLSKDADMLIRQL